MATFPFSVLSNNYSVLIYIFSIFSYYFAVLAAPHKLIVFQSLIILVFALLAFLVFGLGGILGSSTLSERGITRRLSGRNIDIDTSTPTIGNISAERNGKVPRMSENSVGRRKLVPEIPENVRKCFNARKRTLVTQRRGPHRNTGIKTLNPTPSSSINSASRDQRRPGLHRRNQNPPRNNNYRLSHNIKSTIKPMISIDTQQILYSEDVMLNDFSFDTSEGRVSDRKPAENSNRLWMVLPGEENLIEALISRDCSSGDQQTMRILDRLYRYRFRTLVDCQGVCHPRNSNH